MHNSIPQCSICKHFCYLSYLVCKHCSTVYCLGHLKDLCTHCGNNNEHAMLRYRYTPQELAFIFQRFIRGPNPESKEEHEMRDYETLQRKIAQSKHQKKSSNPIQVN